MKRLGLILVLLLSLLQGQLTHAELVSGNKNGILLVTDLLDDDIRGFVAALLHPNLRGRIKGIVITTGNVQLKSAIARQIVWGLGSKIPVWAGTHTDLNKNATTQFAGEWELEGESLLTTRQMKSLHDMEGMDGSAPAQLVKLMEREHAQNKKINVIGITALSDINKAIHLRPELARKTLGTLFGMGFHKMTPDGTIVPPYNIQADPAAGVETSRLWNDGFFEDFVHVPSDIAMLHSGLPNGYLPSTPEGLKILADIEAAMKKFEVLRRILRHAGEYGGNWRHAGMKQFGFTSGWLAGSFNGTGQYSNFYISDLSAVWLAAQTEERLAQLPSVRRALTLNHVAGTGLRFSTNGTRPILDITEFPGMEVMAEYPVLLQNAGNFPPLPGFHKPENVAANDHGNAANIKIDPAPHLNKKALVLNFKNSVDDWFSLVRLLSVPESREALRRGGIIVEGFKTQEVAQAVRAVMQDLGESEVPVAEGKQYGPNEVSHISNFAGEETLYTKGPGLKAFKDLVPAPDTFHLDPESIVHRAGEWAKANNGSFDAIILGEGGDVYKAILKSPELQKYFKKAFLMAGARDGIEPGQYDLTRNWLRDSKSLVAQLKALKQRGAEILCHSSFHFGGSLTSDETGDTGNGKAAFTALKEGAKVFPSFRAIDNFWSDWSATFDWKFNLEKKGIPYDPNHRVLVNTISPLALYVTDSYLKGDRLNQDANIGFESNTLEIPAAGKIRRTKLQTDATTNAAFVTWLTREATKDITTQSRTLGNGIRHFLNSPLAEAHHEAARQFGFPSQAAQSTLAELTLEVARGAGSCAALDQIGQTPTNPPR